MAGAGQPANKKISIHSPHAGRDKKNLTAIKRICNFNPLSPCGERLMAVACENFCGNFNPLSPCGERLGERSGTHKLTIISIHSPHAGRDMQLTAVRKWTMIFQSTLPMRGETMKDTNIMFGLIFQSTLPMRGETQCGGEQYTSLDISIHSPHAGRDEI